MWDVGVCVCVMIMCGVYLFGFVVLGVMEMWERFGYYVARALLALYVTKVLRDLMFDVECVLGL